MNLITFLLIGCCALSMLASNLSAVSLNSYVSTETLQPKPKPKPVPGTVVFNVSSAPTAYLTAADWLASSSRAIVAAYDQSLVTSQLSSAQVVDIATGDTVTLWTSNFDRGDECVAVAMSEDNLALAVESSADGVEVLVFTREEGGTYQISQVTTTQVICILICKC